MPESGKRYEDQPQEHKPGEHKAGENEPGERGLAEDQPPQGTGPLQVAFSVLAAGFGVQSSKNRKRDFEQGRLRHFIIGGIAGTILFVAAIVIAVKVLLATSS